jgi:hypothetical protein
VIGEGVGLGQGIGAGVGAGVGIGCDTIGLEIEVLFAGIRPSSDPLPHAARANAIGRTIISVLYFII